MHQTMTRKLLPFLFCLPIALMAQRSPEEPAIMHPIVNLFKGMNKGDSALARQSFYENVNLQTVTKDKEGNVVLRTGDLDGFMKAIGTPHEPAWDEPIWNVKTAVDGDFAQVWASYAFYLGKEFHHCGVDAFHLIKTPDGWKIFNLVDTRQTEGCNVPTEIKARYK